MAKINFTPELRKLIAETTGLTYLPYNLEKLEDTDGKVVSSILGYYASQRFMRSVVESKVIPAIKKEVPALELKLPNPITGEIEASVEEPNTKVLFSIVAVPSDAKIVINSEERSSIEVEPGTEVAWYVEKDGYVTATGVETVTAETVKEVTLEAVPEPEKVLPTISGGSKPMPSKAPVNTPVECTTATMTGDYAGTMVYSTCKVEPVEGVSIEYKEGDNWLNLPMPGDGTFVFGTPSVGFPLANTESTLRVTVAKPGTYNVTTTLRAVNNEFDPISSVATIVIEAAEVSELPNPNPAENAGDPAEIAEVTVAKAKTFKSK